MQEFEVVFDIVTQGYTEWRVAYVGALFLLVGLMIWLVPYFHFLFGIKKNARGNWGKVIVGFSIFWTLLVLPITYTSHKKVMDKYASNEFEVATGIVEKYEKPIGDSYERGFKIGDKVLWQRNLPLGAEFFQPGLKDIELREGMLIRVTYTGATYLKVEIANKSSHSPH